MGKQKMIQIKNFRAKFLEPDDARYFTGYASVSKQDLDGDIIKPGAFKKTLARKEEISISLAAHGSGANWLGRNGRGRERTEDYQWEINPLTFRRQQRARP